MVSTTVLIPGEYRVYAVVLSVVFVVFLFNRVDILKEIAPSIGTIATGSDNNTEIQVFRVYLQLKAIQPFFFTHTQIKSSEDGVTGLFEVQCIVMYPRRLAIWRTTGAYTEPLHHRALESNIACNLQYMRLLFCMVC